MIAKFGAAGNSDSFYKEGHKASEEMPKWLSDMGLDAYEYQCGNGVRCGEQTARKIAEKAQEHGIIMSVHSPYYINLATPEEEKRAGNINYILQSAQLVKFLGGDRVVVHSGALGKMSREEATEKAKECLKIVRGEMINAGFSDVRLCIETMGKINQLGTLDEVLELCRIDSCFVPVVDFGHLNARDLGGVFKTSDDYLRVFDKIATRMDSYIAENLHCHFSKIEYTSSGEKKHLTFEDTVFGPDYEPFIEAIVKSNLTPTVICESAGTQSMDALTMKTLYKSMI